MAISMERLVVLIQEVEASTVRQQPYLTESDHRLVPIIANMLQELFITAGGHMDFDAKDKFMEEYGYELYPVEHDRWGWVLGGLQTKKGTIVFG